MPLLLWWCWSGEVDDKEAATGNPRGGCKDNVYRFGGIAVGLFSFRADQESFSRINTESKGKIVS